MANYAKTLDIFQNFQGQPPTDDWRKKYWKDKLAHKDEVQRISEEINTASIQKEKQDDYFYEGASVQTVLKKRNPENEVKDFYQAQLDISKDLLPKQTIGQVGFQGNTTVDKDRLRLDLFDQQWHRDEDFAKADDKMLPTPLDAYNVIYPSGNPVPTSAAMKPTSSIAKDDHKGGVRGDDWAPQGKVGSIQLEWKSGAHINPIGDNYLPKTAFDTGFTPPGNVQLSSGGQSKAWDAQKFDDGGFQDSFQSVNKKCNASESPLSASVGSLIEQALNKINKNMNVIDMSSSIASTKEKKVLNKPFRTPGAKTAFAVYTKNQQGELLRVAFDAQASDNACHGPTWTSQHWAAKVKSSAIAETYDDEATQTLNQLSDFFTEKTVNPSANEEWDGYTFYSEKDLVAAEPKLKNALPVYTLNIATTKDTRIGSDTQYNSEVKTQLDKNAAK